MNDLDLVKTLQRLARESANDAVSHASASAAYSKAAELAQRYADGSAHPTQKSPVTPAVKKAGPATGKNDPPQKGKIGRPRNPAIEGLMTNAFDILRIRGVWMAVPEVAADLLVRGIEASEQSINGALMAGVRAKHLQREGDTYRAKGHN